MLKPIVKYLTTMQFPKHAFITLVPLLLLGCSDVPDEPACEVLSLTVVNSSFAVVGHDDRRVKIDVWAPSASGSYPLVVFSHGAFSAPERYDRLLREWAAAGFVVAAPLHIDSELIQHDEPPTPQAVWSGRQTDMQLVSELSLFLRQLPNSVTLAPDHLIAAGHSYGAFVAQAMVGARSEWVDADPSERSIAAVIALSPPGPIPGFIGTDAWRALKTPQLVLTGTADVLPGFIEDWQTHAVAHRENDGTDQWLWVGTDVDHYFGRIFGRLDREVEPQEAPFLDAQKTIIAFMADFAQAATATECRGPLVPYETEIAKLTKRQ